MLLDGYHIALRSKAKSDTASVSFKCGIFPVPVETDQHFDDTGGKSCRSSVMMFPLTKRPKDGGILVRDWSPVLPEFHRIRCALLVRKDHNRYIEAQSSRFLKSR